MGQGVAVTFRRVILWLLLAGPAALMSYHAATGEALLMDLLHPTGEFSIRLMLLAMLVGPLIDIFGAKRILRGWLAIRRNLGVAGFGYALLHLVFYAIDLGALAPIVDEALLPSILTGWLAFAFMMAAALISFNRAMIAMGRHRWKMVQRGVYAAFLLTVFHWGLLDRNFTPALIHLLPLALVWAGRGVVIYRRKQKRKEALA